MKKMIIEIVEVKREKEICFSLGKSFPLRKRESVKNRRFYSAEAAIDWYYSQSFDPEIDWVMVTEWTTNREGGKDDVLSTFVMWDTLPEEKAREELRESRQRGIERLFGISL